MTYKARGAAVAQSEWDRVEAEREELAARAERYADLGLGIHAELLRAGGPVPPSLTDRPIIVDTDIGGDPDDAVAVVVAALTVPELKLVVTTDEVGGERARFARYLLDLCGRPDVAVVAGRQLREAAYFTASGLVPDSVASTRTDVLRMVEAVCAAGGLVRWVGMGPLSNLADVLDVRPHLAHTLVVTQMGGAVKYRDPSRAEHNIRLDPRAARDALAVLSRPELVTSDVTFSAEIELDEQSGLYRWFASPEAPGWAQVLRAHFDQWFARYHPGSMQHDALTLSAALQLPFVDFYLRRIAFDSAGRMTVGDGMEVFLSRKAEYGAFMCWLERGLTASTIRAPQSRKPPS
ncbi:nucleoside hydrolase [Protofrankia symbiont of Coriaria ruscifolia]|uniref:nucleoside hydrolase n=1 Tax=Protofrankia symbiont of Coriaria ruscifolia TaxID=1306542 RepID=UPI0010415D7F|nr:nucleoside hydrolase [Protofrankia symbiont of Coriaria ruscifolia]